MEKESKKGRGDIEMERRETQLEICLGGHAAYTIVVNNELTLSVSSQDPQTACSFTEIQNVRNYWEEHPGRDVVILKWRGGTHTNQTFFGW